MSRLPLIIHPLYVRTAHVESIRDVTPLMRRVVLAGPQLEAFTAQTAHGPVEVPPFRAPAFDDHVKIVLSEDPEQQPPLPEQLAEGIEWTPAPHRAARDYTPRWVRPAADCPDGVARVALDFVLHGEGPAASWAAMAQPGQALSFVGPKSSLVLPERVSAMVLVGDETALPAVGRFFDEWPIEAPAHAILFCTSSQARQDLALRDGDSVTWVPMPEPDGPAMLAAVTEHLDDADLGDAPFLWAAGEAASLLPLRRWAGRTLGLPKDRMSVTGYWHVPRAGREAAEPEPTGQAAEGGSGSGRAASSSAEPGAERPVGRVPEAPTHWFAAAAALNTGVLDLLYDREDAGHAAGAEEIREHLRAREEARGAAGGAPSVRTVAALLDAVAEAGIAVERAGTWALTRAGRELVEDEHLRESFEPPTVARTQALAQLDVPLAGAGSAWEAAFGESFATCAAADPDLLEPVEDEAAGLMFLRHPVYRCVDRLGARRLVVTGPGAQMLAQLLQEREPAQWPEGRAPEVRLEHDAAAAGPAQAQDADAVISVLRLGMLDDAEARRHLQTLAAAPAALLIESGRPDALSPRASEQSLMSVALTGRASRSPEEIREQAESVGFRSLETVQLGWGMEAHLLGR